jgi:hypothetical protein
MKVAAEKQRLAEDKASHQNWRRWGPYVSERQWGTVREDYSPGGNAWEYFPHDHARSRAYRWSEDGIAGFSDDIIQSSRAIRISRTTFYSTNIFMATMDAAAAHHIRPAGPV